MVIVLNEKDIIKKILSGDEKAFYDFIEQYKNLVSHIIYKMINNIDDTEDLAQEVFIKIYKNLSKFKFQCKLSSWIGKIAYNHCLNYIKKNKKNKESNFNEEEFIKYGFDSDKNNSYSSIKKKEIDIFIDKALNQLPDLYKTIISLYHLDGLNYKEICEITSLPEGSVKSYLFRGRKILKETLLNKYKLEELWI